MRFEKNCVERNTFVPIYTDKGYLLSVIDLYNDFNS